MSLREILRRYAPFGSDTFLSFRKPLTQLIRFMEPRQVVEFGPGHSTELFLKHSEAEVWSFETRREWFERNRSKFNSPRVLIIHQHADWDLAEFQRYTDSASIVFIDGCDRLRALLAAYDLIGQDGAVYLHDAHREEYEPGIRRYPWVYFPERHSCILCRNEGLHRRIIEVVAADYSCRCRYCSTPARRAYFDRMSTQRSADM